MARATVSIPAVGGAAALASVRSTRRGRRCASPSIGRAGCDARRRVVVAASDKTDENSPPYQVAQRKDLYELRIYGAYYVTRAPYSNREQGLASLMGYVEGGNEEEKTFPATQPLIMRYVDAPDKGGFEKTMELSLGADATDPPAPTVGEARVAAAGGELLAVVGFEGVATPELAGKYRELLTTAVEADGLKVADPSEFRLATYGQLYSLKPRLNELMLKVKLPGA